MAVSIPASGSFDGNDGPWSTFNLFLGNETVRVLPATSGDVIWVVGLEGCADQPFSQAECAESRGRVVDLSDNFNMGGLPSMSPSPFEPEADLGGNYSIAAGGFRLGYGSATILQPLGETFSVQNLAIMGFVADTPYLGLIGLSSQGPGIVSNGTTTTGSIPSLLENLIGLSWVKSSSWSYTAGARYLNPPVSGSLTFGGYDASRGDQKAALTVPMASNTTHDLLVAIDEIYVESATHSASYQGEYLLGFIDSVVPEIWLPTAACAMFESAFGLVWDDYTSLYLVNDTQHAKLMSQNASVIISLSRPSYTSEPASDGQTTNITLPYAAFDLEARYPVAGIQNNSTQRYFPLKKAISNDQVTLGRTFLQQAYLSVDYDRKHFTVSPTLFPRGGSSETNMTTINPPKNAHASALHQVSTRVKIDIIVGSISFVIVIVSLILFCWLRERRQTRRNKSRNRAKMDAADEELRRMHEQEQQKGKPELDAKGTARGMPNERQELGSKEGAAVTELASESVYEAPTSFEGTEMESNREPTELA